MSDEPRTLAEIRSYSDIPKLLRARRDELNIPNDVIDELAGLCRGHTSKVLNLRPTNHLIGRISWHIFEALGLRILVVEDPAALARSQRRSVWQHRRQRHRLPTAPYPKSAA